MRLVVYPITFQALKDEIIKNLDVTVQKQTELITKWVEERVADARLIASNPFVLLAIQSLTDGNTGSAEVFKYLDTIKYFDYLWKEYGAKEVFIADREGFVRIASGKDFVGMNISAKDYFRSAMNGAFFTSSILPSDVPVENEAGMLEVGVPTMLVSAPVKDKSNFVVGTVTLRIDISEIDKMMQNIHIGVTGETYLINGHGYMLTESRFIEDLKSQQRVKKRSALELKVTDPGTNNLTRGVRECLKGSEGFDADGYTDYRGVKVLGFWKWMPDYGWGVIAEVDVNEGYGKLYELRNYVLFIFGIVAMGVIIVAFFLSKRVSAPLYRITEIAKAIASGSYNTRVIYSSNDEIGELAGAINKMAEMLAARSQMTGHQTDEKGA
jgi:HAMP domain-containing protein